MLKVPIHAPARGHRCCNPPGTAGSGTRDCPESRPPDATLAHVAYRGLAQLGAHQPALAVFKNTNSSTQQVRGASLALMRIHKKEVVDAMLDLLKDKSTSSSVPPSKYSQALSSGKAWDRKHWGGCPDTRGPYYEMVTWEQSERIMKALRGALWKMPKDEVGEYLSRLEETGYRTMRP